MPAWLEKMRSLPKRELDAELLRQFRADNVMNSMRLIDLGADPSQELGGKPVLQHLVDYQTRDPALRKRVTGFLVEFKKRERVESAAIERMKKSID